MNASVTRLQQIALTLPSEHLQEVIDFAEFLSLKTREELARSAQNSTRANTAGLEIPVIKGVKFVGDPLLRREDLYDDRGR